MNKYKFFIITVTFCLSFLLFTKSNFALLSESKTNLEVRERVLYAKKNNLDNIATNKEKLNKLSINSIVTDKSIVQNENIGLYLGDITQMLTEYDLEEMNFKIIDTMEINSYDQNSNMNKVTFSLSFMGNFKNIFGFIGLLNNEKTFNIDDLVITPLYNKDEDLLLVNLDFSIFTIDTILDKIYDLPIQSIKDYKNPFYYDSTLMDDAYE